MLPSQEVVQEVQVFGVWVSPFCLEPILLLEQGVGDDELDPQNNSRSKCPLSLQLPIPYLPWTPFHSSKSRPTLALKSPKIRSLSLEST